MTVVAWLADDEAGREAYGVVTGGNGRSAIGAIPGVVLVDEPTPEVQFAAPAWGVEIDPAQMPALEVVQLRSAGVDWIVDKIPASITLCSARGTRDAAMAEWTVAALLADVKRVRPFAEAQAARRWERLDISDLRGLRVLLLGHGSIGRETERLLAPFGCDVRGVARRPRDGVAGLDELGALLPWADAVVNLLPLTAATRGMVDAERLRSMRDGALYVSAGRGATTDTYALLAELQSGRLRAVLDVVDPEPLPADHPLWCAPGVLLSPHVAGDTPGGDRAAWVLVGEQLGRFARGEPLRNVVAEGY
ncbi:MAG TPA: NAD(P)-dependent oxidoreductase [Baekduia sp.]|uniref:NAD(P)-dependent oxidoreductase n=1 Tax=Baekduia sp. TaxID=2600305 RepID=UPI002C4A7740|nr:NAD(P)-dependent oxidoreductase [Baekduia sp.]HMJ35542.1 NAD(P)-dependent oxidoreductase [Baekduia sp.]